MKKVLDLNINKSEFGNYYQRPDKLSPYMPAFLKEFPYSKESKKCGRLHRARLDLVS